MITDLPAVALSVVIPLLVLLLPLLLGRLEQCVLPAPDEADPLAR